MAVSLAKSDVVTRIRAGLLSDRPTLDTLYPYGRTELTGNYTRRTASAQFVTAGYVYTSVGSRPLISL